jgi:hypothetical protein
LLFFFILNTATPIILASKSIPIRTNNNNSPARRTFLNRSIKKINYLKINQSFMKLTYEAVDMITKRGQNMNKGTNSVIIDGTCPYTFISRVI